MSDKPQKADTQETKLLRVCFFMTEAKNFDGGERAVEDVRPYKMPTEKRVVEGVCPYKIPTEKRAVEDVRPYKIPTEERAAGARVKFIKIHLQVIFMANELFPVEKISKKK